MEQHPPNLPLDNRTRESRNLAQGFERFDIEDSSAGERASARNPGGFGRMGMLVGLSTALLLLVAVVVCSTRIMSGRREVSPAAVIRYSDDDGKYQQYDQSCWNSSSSDASIPSILVKDASCAGELVCARKGCEGRDFGDCPGHHCCSVVPRGKSSDPPLLWPMTVNATALLRSLAGHWAPAPGCKAAWMPDLDIDEDGSFETLSGETKITDGLARVLSVSHRMINLKRTSAGANDHVFVVDANATQMVAFCPKCGRPHSCGTCGRTLTLIRVVDSGKTNAAEALVRSLAGRWAPAPEDNSDWMTGLNISEDGSFVTKSGLITDGSVRVLSVSHREINLKRTVEDANDHILAVDKDASRMTGWCPQSGTTYTLTRVSDSSNTEAKEALVRSLAGKWASAPEVGSDWMTGLSIAEDGTFVTRSGLITDGLVRVLSLSHRTINLKRKVTHAHDHILAVDEDARRMTGWCPQTKNRYTLTRVSDSSKTAEEQALLRSLAGRWAPAPEDESVWMTGLTIAENGTFECRSGQIKDGSVRILSMPHREINLKRTSAGAHDHVLALDVDASRMKGWCPQSGSSYTLTRVADSSETDAKDAFVRSLAGTWSPALGAGSHWMEGLKIAENGSFVCNSGLHADGLLQVLSVSHRGINLKRTVADANDHILTVDEDGSHMKGWCPQSRCIFTLTRIADSKGFPLSVAD